MHRSIPTRRGITLLFVISLIVLFLLMGATFVAISGNFRRTSEARRAVDSRGDSGRATLDRGLHDIIRGSNSATSPLRDHHLLGDMYGQGFKGVVSDGSAPGTVAPAFEANGQLIRISLNLSVPPTDPTLLDKVGAFGGQVLTFTSDSTSATPASLKGLSCRIFHYDVQYDAAGVPLSRSFLIVPEWTNGLNPFNNPADLVGASVLVNGRAFAGVGAEPNEPYDALDTRNAFLAGVDFESYPRVYASFFHFDSTVTGAYEAFRPTQFQAVPLADGNGDGLVDLEIDNDGDGNPDSIWIDPGYAIQSDKSGRMYKTLVSYLVVDLDGRFNLNLHGSGDDARGRNVVPLNLLGAPPALVQGQGYGPAEIFLGRLFPPPGGFPATPANYNQEYFNVLGDPMSPYFGRFGSDGGTGIYATGQSLIQDPWSQSKLFGHPVTGIGNLFGSRMDIHGKYALGFSNVVYNSPQGDLPNGMPGIDATPLADDIVDNPYEVDLSGFPTFGPSENPLVASGSTRPDQLFSLKELERVYRAHDMDSRILADRIVELAPSLDATRPGSDPKRRLMVATESVDVPVPPANMASALCTYIAAPFLGQVSTLLPPEVLQGLKMDPNRPFGNGVDDNGNGVIDEYFMPGNGEVSAESVPHPSGPVELDVSRNGVLNSPTTDDNLLIARGIFAKHLYVLAFTYLRSRGGAGDFDGDMTITPGVDLQWGIAGVDDDGNTVIDDVSEAGWPGSDDIISGTLADDSDDQLALAQWCVNAVDFRDPDAIMTPFEFDLNPFNGWECDGALSDNGAGLYVPDGPETRVVWGCERPELLISETIALHDRRTEDTPTGNTLAGGDALHFDNRLRPEAAAFVELYAPWVGGNDVTYPSELYTSGQVDLARTSPVGDPIWRVAVAGPDSDDDEYLDATFSATSFDDNRNRDPDDTFNPGGNAASISRVVYFIPNPGAPFLGSGGAEAFYATTAGPKLLPVGQFAVVGSSGNVNAGLANATTLGRRILDGAGTPVVEGDAAVLADTRYIALDTAANVVRIRDFHEATGTMVTLDRPALVIPAEFPLAAGTPQRPFNMSDPVGGYPAADSTTLPAVSTADGWIYTTPYDEPLDFVGRVPTDYEYKSLRDDKTTPTYRVVHLQRLANPMTDWDPVRNPYRTVDSMSVNLTAYNGISPVIDESASGPRQDVDSLKPNYDPTGLDTRRDCASMERGRNRKYPPAAAFDPISADVFQHRELWSQDGLNTGAVRRRGYLTRLDPGINEINRAGFLGWHLSFEPATIVGDPDQHLFNSTIFETLGTYNDAWFDHWQGIGPWPVSNATPTNPPARDGDGVAPGIDPPPALLGLDATKPFAWLTWNNRPYVSHHELMLVPKLSSSNLLRDFQALASANPYDPAIPGFSHLMNFFVGETSSGGGPPARNYLGGLLDFVEVPSRYVGTERRFLPNPAAGSATPQFEAVFGDLASPFDFVSRFRVPGRVNINTELSRDLWTGIMHEYADAIPTGGPFLDYTRMHDSRTNPATGEFVRPFREYSAPTTSPGDNEGLLRRGPAADPLFVYDPAVQEPHNNSDRNAYFRYDPIQRLGNLVTTRSNVYAIWITVGYFEVDPATQDLLTTSPATSELGAENGQIRRHRGFFIYDRSVPVGYELGVDHNISRGILVESYIE